MKVKQLQTENAMLKSQITLIRDPNSDYMPPTMTNQMPNQMPIHTSKQPFPLPPSPLSNFSPLINKSYDPMELQKQMVIVIYFFLIKI